MMKTHMEPAKTMARARMVVDAVELRVDPLFQPAGSTEVSNTTVEGVEVGMGDGEELGGGCTAEVLAVELPEHCGKTC